MASKIKIAIAGYGNLGRGVEQAVSRNGDMELTGIFTRRDPEKLIPCNAGTPVRALDSIKEFTGAINVLILCGGSKSDLPEQGPALAAMFNTVDSFDTHPKIPDYFDAVNRSAQKGGTTAIISAGWDPGLFSLNRLYGEAILPDAATYTFWGKGLSQGHSDAIRRIEGVKAAVQYTIPSPDAVQRARSGERPALSTREKHTRDCYVVLKSGADAEKIRRAIVTMPDYFADYDTSVTFIRDDELQKNHSAMPHGGVVIRTGETGTGARQVMEYSLKLESNPEFTASVLTACARAAFRLNQQGQVGAKTVFDIAPGLLSPKSAAMLRKELL